MYQTSGDYLFSGNPLDDSLRSRQIEFRDYVNQIDPNQILTGPVEDLVRVAVERFEVACPVLRPDERYTPGAKDIQIDVTGDPMRFTSPYGRTRIPGTEISLKVPFSGDSNVFHLRPQTWSMNPPRGEIANDTLTITARTPADVLNMESIKQEFDSTLDRIQKQLEISRGQINLYNSSLQSQAETILMQRREKILRDRQLEEFIAVRVAQRDDPSTILAVEVPRRSPIPSSRPKTSAPFLPEPAIDEEAFDALMRTIAAFGSAAERFPETFGPMPEPVLRELLLVVLNNQFGPAVGEMFSRVGKTDIAILRDDGPVFIAECKIWSGPADFANAIDQLLSYVVWRDTKVAIVLFVRNKDVTALIDKAITTLNTHAAYKRTASSHNGRNIYVLHHPDDARRELRLALIVIPIPGRTDPGGSPE